MVLVSTGVKARSVYPFFSTFHGQSNRAARESEGFRGRGSSNGSCVLSGAETALMGLEARPPLPPTLARCLRRGASRQPRLRAWG